MFRQAAIDIDYILKHGTKIQQELSNLYNQLHHTAHLPKNRLLKSKFNHAKTYNQSVSELKVLLSESKTKENRKKDRKKIEAAENILRTSELSFMKIKNIKLDNTEKLYTGYSLGALSNDVSLPDEILSAYLSISPPEFIAEVSKIEERVSAYQNVITTFLEDIENHLFIIDEMQSEIAKQLAMLSSEISNSIDEERFWHSVLSNISKHYIVPIFIKELLQLR